MIKIGIDGFVRIDRMVFRTALKSKYFKVVAINDLISHMHNVDQK